MSEQVHTFEKDMSTQYDFSVQSLTSANINPNTMLATDYLNHFNEIAMLFEIVASDPDSADLLADWEAKTYEQHFLDSNLHFKHLAIEAYKHSPASVRKSFDSVVEDLNKTILAAQSDEKLELDGEERCHVYTVAARDVCRLIEQASSIINNTKMACNADQEHGERCQVAAQYAVDELFN